MNDKLEEAKLTAESRLDELDARVTAKDERLREKYGMSWLLARAIDLGAIGFGAYLIYDMGMLYKAVGLVLVLGGIFGFLYNRGGSE